MFQFQNMLMTSNLAGSTLLFNCITSRLISRLSTPLFTHFTANNLVKVITRDIKRFRREFSLGACTSCIGIGRIMEQAKQKESQSNIDSTDDVNEREIDNSVPRRKKNRKKKKAEMSSERIGDERRHSKPRPRPNHFVCFRIVDRNILKILEEVQTMICLEDQKFKKAMVAPKKSHITVSLLNLQTDDDITKAIDAMNNVKTNLDQLIQEGMSNTILIKGVGTFEGRVVYCKIIDSNFILSNMAKLLKESFTSKGLTVITSGEEDQFTPHLTIMKLSRDQLFYRKQKIRRIPNELYSNWAETEFGSETVNKMILCSMDKDDEDGFYLCPSEINLATPKTESNQCE